MYDIVGDLHSCFVEFDKLLTLLGYNEDNFSHPDGRKIVLVGDVFDRGWYPALTFFRIRDMVSSGALIMAKGNHDDKLERWAKGNNVQLSHGLDGTIEGFQKAGITSDQVLGLFDSVPHFLALDDDKLIVVHAAWKDKYISVDPTSRRLRSWCLYGPTTGRTINGYPERIDWASDREMKYPMVIHGHQPIHEVRKVNNVWNIDTGCTFGGKLTAVKYPEMEIVQVDSLQQYCYHEGW